MRKALKILGVLLLCGVFFLLGWRVMPKVWPTIKTHVVYPLFPQLKPAPVQLVAYEPKSDAALGDPLGATDSVVYYIYKPYCPYCKNLEPLTGGLPDELVLADGTRSRVVLIALDKSQPELYEKIQAFYEANGIEEERQYVPAMVVGERYLATDDEIMAQMWNSLVLGEGLTTPLFDGAERVE